MKDLIIVAEVSLTFQGMDLWLLEALQKPESIEQALKVNKTFLVPLPKNKSLSMANEGVNIFGSVEAKQQKIYIVETCIEHVDVRFTR